MARAAVLQRFLEQVSNAIEESGPAPPAVALANKIFNAAGRSIGQDAPAGGPAAPQLPVSRWLERGLDNALDHGGQIARIAETLACVTPRLQWFQRPSSPTDDPRFSEHHANAELFGPRGLEQREDIRIGISVLAPATRYPDHQHPPEEIYSVMSRGEWRCDQSDWYEPGIGSTVHHTPNVMHAMRSTDEPLLAVWCLWLGDN